MELSSNLRKLLENTVVKGVKNAKIERVKEMHSDELFTILLIEIFNKKPQIKSGDGMTINF